MPTPLGSYEIRAARVRIHGHEISYMQAGEGPVLLLVHGIASTSQTWLESIPLLARRFTVIAPDLPGHGCSDKPPGDYSIGSLASSMRDLLVALGHERASIAGHSLGGGVAMQFAYMYPERCERLLLVCSGGLGRSVNPLLRAAALPGAELVLAATAPGLTAAGRLVGRGMQRLGLRAASDLSEVSRGFASLVDPETRTAFLETLRSVIKFSGQSVNASNRLYLASEMPTLIVWGARDPIIPVGHGRRAHQLMPHSRFECFADAGHMPQVDDPHRFADLVLEFCDANPPSNVTPERWRELLQHGAPAADDALEHPAEESSAEESAV
ncbi:MAG: alpha/beta fold hydrolase [Solirubrobacteraceae bacterium]